MVAMGFRTCLIGSAVLATLLLVPAASAAGRPFTATLTFSETNPGQSRGDAVVGVVGVGRITVKLTGKPFAPLAKGGSYVARWDIDAKGISRGLLVATLASRPPGTVCVRYTAVPGRFKAGQHFVPVGGDFSSVGGTGAGATLSLSGHFDQADISGKGIETLTGRGSATVALGAPKPGSAACRAVAKLAKP
jgi:hypothetical protein